MTCVNLNQFSIIGYLRTQDSYTALATKLWQQYFQMFELSEVMRQKEDKDLAKILNRIGEGQHTEQTLQF